MVNVLLLRPERTHTRSQSTGFLPHRMGLSLSIRLRNTNKRLFRKRFVVSRQSMRPHQRTYKYRRTRLRTRWIECKAEVFHLLRLRTLSKRPAITRQSIWVSPDISDISDGCDMAQGCSMAK